MHLTNYSVNRRSSDFKASSSASSDDGSKRSISSVFRMLRKERGVDIDKVWSGGILLLSVCPQLTL